MRFRRQSTNPATSQSSAASPTIASATTVVHEVRSALTAPAGESVVTSEPPANRGVCGTTCGNAGNTFDGDGGFTGTIGGAAAWAGGTAGPAGGAVTCGAAAGGGATAGAG